MQKSLLRILKMDLLVQQALNHPFVQLRKKDTCLISQHTVPSLVLFEKNKQGEWWWGRSFTDLYPLGHVVNLATRDANLVRKMYSMNPFLSPHLATLQQCENKFLEVAKNILKSNNRLIVHKNFQIDIVSKDASLFIIRNANEQVKKQLKELHFTCGFSIVSIGHKDCKLLISPTTLILLIERLLPFLSPNSSLHLKEFNELKSKRLVIVQGVDTDYLGLDIQTYPKQYKWNVMGTGVSNSVPFVVLAGTKNDSSDIKINSHDPSTQSFSVKQPLGWLNGYFDENGSFVKIARQESEMQKKLGKKYVAYGYKICSRRGYWLPQGKATNHLSISQMILVKLGFTSNTNFSLYSKTGKIRANQADVVAMASIIPIDISKLVIKLRMDVTESFSVYNSRFAYVLGEHVSIYGFNYYPRPYCGAGVHFFWDPLEAIRYKYPMLGRLKIKNLEKFAAICFNPKEKTYEVFPSTEDEAATIIQFFWRLYKSRKDWCQRLNQLSIDSLTTTIDAGNSSKLRNIIQYWREITWEHKQPN